MARRGENIFKRKDGRWEARYIKDRDQSGKAIYGYVYSRSYKEVKLKRQNMIASIVKDNEVLNCRFEQLIDSWLEHIVPLVKDSTLQSYKRHISNHIMPYFEGYYANSITQKSLQDFITYKLVRGRLDNKGGLSAKTVKELISVIQSVLKYGDEIDVCQYNHFRLKLPKIKHHIDRLSIEEELKLVKSLRRNSIGISILLSLYCGMRVGEICALENNDINLERRTIYISKTLYRIKSESKVGSKTKIVISEAKTENSTRYVPIPNCVYDILKSHKSKYKYFISGSDTPFEPRKINYQLKSALRKAHVRDIRFHTLRHTFASKCIENGFDYNVLSEILGHSKASTTMNIYVHTSSNSKRMYMDRLELISSQNLSQI